MIASKTKINVFLKKFLHSSRAFGAAPFRKKCEQMIILAFEAKQYGFPKLYFFRILSHITEHYIYT